MDHSTATQHFPSLLLLLQCQYVDIKVALGQFPSSDGPPWRPTLPYPHVMDAPCDRPLLSRPPTPHASSAPLLAQPLRHMPSFRLNALPPTRYSAANPIAHSPFLTHPNCGLAMPRTTPHVNTAAPNTPLLHSYAPDATMCAGTAPARSTLPIDSGYQLSLPSSGITRNVSPSPHAPYYADPSSNSSLSPLPCAGPP